VSCSLKLLGQYAGRLQLIISFHVQFKICTLQLKFPFTGTNI